MVFGCWPCAFGECDRFAVEVFPFDCSIGVTIPQGLNDSGDVVGFFFCGAGNDRAFVKWSTSTTITPLNLPSNDSSRGLAINAGGQVVGWVSTFSQRGFVFEDQSPTDLGNLPTNWIPWVEAYSINASGIAVGSSSVRDGSYQHAYRWVDSSMIDLDIPFGPSNEAKDINDRGQIVGWMGVAPIAHFAAEAFRWENGKTTPLGKPHGASSSTANAISNSGIICGYCIYPNPEGPGGNARRARAWIDGKMIDLGVLSGYVQSLAFDVNNARDIVGYCSKPPSGASIAFIWRDGHMKALADLLAPGDANYQVWLAYGINSQGQITAAVKLPQMSERAALLTPIPPRSGDTNCDWLVNVNDLLNVINAWGPAAAKTPFQSSPDLNDDGTVNVNDLLAVINDWG